MPVEKTSYGRKKNFLFSGSFWWISQETGASGLFTWMGYSVTFVHRFYPVVKPIVKWSATTENRKRSTRQVNVWLHPIFIHVKQKNESNAFSHVCYLPQSDGGRQWGVVELGALWLWVKALWWLLEATGPGARSVRGLMGSGSCTEQDLDVGLVTGVPWTGGDGHGEPRGDTLEGGKPDKGWNNWSVYNLCLFVSLLLNMIWDRTWSSQWFVVDVIGGDRDSTGGRHGATLWDGHHYGIIPRLADFL